MGEPKGRIVGIENSESGVSDAGDVFGPATALGKTESDVCQLGTMDSWGKDEPAAEETFPDSDDSEKRRRKFDRRRTADPLKKLIKSEFNELVSFLENKIPETVHILSFIKVLMASKNSNSMKREGFKYKILISRDECRPKYPFIMAFYDWMGQTKGSMYAMSSSGVQIFKEALKHSRYFPIKGVGCEWCLYPIEVALEFTKYWTAHDGGGYSPKYTSFPVHLYWMPKEDLTASEYLQSPREIRTQPLDNSCVATVNYFWGRRHERSSKLIEAMISNNLSLGAFTFNDEFVAWAVQTHYGALDLIFTVPKYRGKGLGRSLLLNLSTMLEDKGLHPHAFAPRDNYALTIFLKKSGFKFVSENIYFYVDPPLEPALFPKPPDN